MTWATQEVTGREWASIMFRSLLANADFRNRFVNAASDHLNTTFQPSHIEALANQLHDRLAPYLREHAER